MLLKGPSVIPAISFMVKNGRGPNLKANVTVWRQLSVAPLTLCATARWIGPQSRSAPPLTNETELATRALGFKEGKGKIVTNESSRVMISKKEMIKTQRGLYFLPYQSESLIRF